MPRSERVRLGVERLAAKGEKMAFVAQRRGDADAPAQPRRDALEARQKCHYRPGCGWRPMRSTPRRTRRFRWPRRPATSPSSTGAMVTRVRIDDDTSSRVHRIQDRRRPDARARRQGLVRSSAAEVETAWLLPRASPTRAAQVAANLTSHFGETVLGFLSAGARPRHLDATERVLSLGCSLESTGTSEQRTSRGPTRCSVVFGPTSSTP